MADGERHEPQGATIGAKESALGISFRVASKPFGDPQPWPLGIQRPPKERSFSSGE
jgi:hypothetical protein